MTEYGRKRCEGSWSLYLREELQVPEPLDSGSGPPSSEAQERRKQMELRLVQAVGEQLMASCDQPPAVHLS